MEVVWWCGGVVVYWEWCGGVVGVVWWCGVMEEDVLSVGVVVQLEGVFRNLLHDLMSCCFHSC